MRRASIALLLAVAACQDARPGDPLPASGRSVILRRQRVEVTHLTRDPERRYPGGPGVLCSWDRDRFLHFFSRESPQFSDIAFLDSAGRVVEISQLASSSEVGLTSKSEARHALFLTAGTLKKDGVRTGDKVAFSPAIESEKAEPMPVVKVGGHDVHVETSHRFAERRRGLMHRPRLSKDDGMLFLYAAEDDRSYYMLNTLIPLDIAFFDGEGRLLNVRRMKPADDPALGADLKAPSAGPARFVLEVNYGWFDERGLIDAEGMPAKPVKLELPDALRRLADQAE